MKKDTCTAVMDRFLALDKGEALPPAVKLHSIHCTKCRTLIKSLAAAENLGAETFSAITPKDDPAVARIMSAIPATAITSEEPVQIISLKRWIWSGCVLVAAVLLFGTFSTADGGAKLQILLNLCFALFIAGYCAFFVGSNLNFFTKKIQTALEPHTL